MKPYLLFLIIIMCGQISAQEDGQQQLVEKYVALYMNAVRNHAIIYNGKESEKYPRVQNNPYFKGILYTEGQLSYNGVIYPGVYLQLDLCRDELVVLSPDYLFNVVLSPDKVDYAHIHGYHVFPLQSDGLPGCPSSGFYLRLYSKGCVVLEKQSTTLEIRDREPVFMPSVKYYLRKDDVYYRLRGKRSLLKALGSHKKELKQYVRHSHLSFRENAETMIVSVVKEYERLNSL